MIEAVFISDLHLHPEQPDILARFLSFIEWARHAVKNVYILGDFFHAWPGDDSIDDWSMEIAKQINGLVSAHVSVFFMPGNRDFLLGKRFAQLAKWQVIPEPAFVHFGSQQIMLVHGDRYCTKDRSHQWFRRVTRNRLFSPLFLCLSLEVRKKLVDSVRTRSLTSKKNEEQMDVVAESVVAHMKRYHANCLIHGHTHRPGLTVYDQCLPHLSRYVLSDWDDTPVFLCYDFTKGIYFNQI